MFKNIGKFIGETIKDVVTIPIELGEGIIEGVMGTEDKKDKKNDNKEPKEDKQ